MCQQREFRNQSNFLTSQRTIFEWWFFYSKIKKLLKNKKCGYYLKLFSMKGYNLAQIIECKYEIFYLIGSSFEQKSKFLQNYK